MKIKKEYKMLMFSKKRNDYVGVGGVRDTNDFTSKLEEMKLFCSNVADDINDMGWEIYNYKIIERTVQYSEWEEAK